MSMPHWVALLAIVVAGWLILAVVGGWLLGRGLGAFERHQAGDPGDGTDAAGRDDLRRAA
jgi:hypothetical protein